MIVCHCKGLTDHDIRKAAREGAVDSSDVARSCAAGTDCGGCRPLVDEILSKESPAQHRVQPRIGS